ncbi:MAG: PEP-CTERM sorting domain-containing protein, partial [Planctomycetota bacterium]
SEGNITTIVMDLSGSANNAVFDPSDYIFTDISTDSTGFDGNFSLNGNQELTLMFNLGDFDPGETFAFQVDVDDGNGQTTGADFAGSILTASFSGTTQDLVATYVDDGGTNASATGNLLTTPEPGTFSTLSLGLIALAASRRRRQHNQS